MNNSSLISESFSCLKIPDLVPDLPAGTQDGLLDPCADLLMPAGLWQTRGPGSLGQVGTPRLGGYEGAEVSFLLRGVNNSSSGPWEGTEGGDWAPRGT